MVKLMSVLYHQTFLEKRGSCNSKTDDLLTATPRIQRSPLASNSSKEQAFFFPFDKKTNSTLLSYIRFQKSKENKKINLKK